MKTLLLSLLLFAIAVCVRSQVKLLQTGAAQVKPSQTLRLTCSVSGFSLTSSGYGVSWIRQPPGKGLEWLSIVFWNEDKYYQESLKNRLTISRDTSKSEVYLEMRGMEAGDSGTYYCTRSYKERGDYWGQGTMVTVTSASPTAPSVFPLSSCTGEGTTSQVTFGCLAKGYFPEPVTVTWSPNVGSSGVKTYPSILKPSSGLYSLSSQVTVPASSWESDTYRCTVQHQPTRSTTSTEIPKPTVGEPHAPEVEVLYSCTTNPGTVQLVCLISGFYPKALTVEWLVDGEHGLLHSHNHPDKKNSDGTFSTRSIASVSQSKWLEGKTYTCQVSHPGSSTTKQDHARKCEGDCPQG